MSSKSARREYLQAVAEFQKSLRNFAKGMGHVLEPEAQPDVEEVIRRELGPSKSAKRAPRSPAPDSGNVRAA
jgi:hypothetical protein